MKEKCFDVDQINMFSVVVIPFIFTCLFLPFLQWYSIEIKNILSIHSLIILLVSVICGFFIHEIIHAIVFSLYAKNGFKSIKFGIIWKHAALYCHCNEFITVSQYRLALFMPTLILGFFPVLIAYMCNNFLLLFFGCILLTGGIGDFICLWMLKDMDKKCLVMDHPNKVGFYYTNDQG